jgi:feruloyl esterase
MFSLVLAAAAAVATPATSCDSLQSMATPQVAITTEAVAAVTPRPGAGRGGPAVVATPAYCKVKLVLKPTADSKINAELWLPNENWNGRFMAVGNGGFGGSIQGIGEMQTAVRLGYATAGGDTGHDEATEGAGGMFASGWRVISMLRFTPAVCIWMWRLASAPAMMPS